MKNATQAGVKQFCIDCHADPEWKKEIELTSQEYKFKEHVKYRWTNPDGSNHVVKVGDSFIHVWNEGEGKIAKENGGTAALRANRLALNKPPLEQGLKKTELLNDGKYQTDLEQLNEIEYEAREFLKHNSSPVNDQKVGLWTKLIFQKRYAR